MSTSTAGMVIRAEASVTPYWPSRCWRTRAAAISERFTHAGMAENTERASSRLPVSA